MYLWALKPEQLRYHTEEEKKSLKFNRVQQARAQNRKCHCNILLFHLSFKYKIVAWITHICTFFFLLTLEVCMIYHSMIFFLLSLEKPKRLLKFQIRKIEGNCGKTMKIRTRYLFCLFVCLSVFIFTSRSVVIIQFIITSSCGSGATGSTRLASHSTLSRVPCFIFFNCLPPLVR